MAPVSLHVSVGNDSRDCGGVGLDLWGDVEGVRGLLGADWQYPRHLPLLPWFFPGSFTLGNFSSAVFVIYFEGTLSYETFAFFFKLHIVRS